MYARAYIYILCTSVRLYVHIFVYVYTPTCTWLETFLENVVMNSIDRGRRGRTERTFHTNSLGIEGKFVVRLSIFLTSFLLPFSFKRSNQVVLLISCFLSFSLLFFFSHPHLTAVISSQPRFPCVGMCVCMQETGSSFLLPLLGVALSCLFFFCRQNDEFQE